MAQVTREDLLAVLGHEIAFDVQSTVLARQNPVMGYAYRHRRALHDPYSIAYCLFGAQSSIYRNKDSLGVKERKLSLESSSRRTYC
jgi:hypothetical protein